MLLERIEKYVDLKALQKERRKIDSTFIMAGILGVFVYHYVGSKLSTMFWTAFWVTGAGLISLILVRWKKPKAISPSLTPI